MKDFIKISILLSIYGIFKEFRPSEPYLVPYMTEPPLNFTAEQVSHVIFPVSTYSTFVLLVVVFLVTDFLRYKVVIIVQAICATSIYLMLLFCRGVFQMQMMQVVYGMYSAGEVAYFTYIYAKVEKEHFQEVTSYTRSAYLIGRSLSGVASQAVVYYIAAEPYQCLLWLTVGSELMALIWAFLLPSVDKSVYFHRNLTEEDKSNNEITSNKESSIGCKTVLNFLWTDFKTAFTNMYVLKWALWWAMASCGYYMVLSYIQVLWTTVRAESNTTDAQLNGAVETIYTLLGAFASMMVGKVKLNWEKLGDPLLATCSLVIAALLYTMCMTHNVYVAYIGFILFTIIFQTVITVANSEVAKHVSRDSYGLIFGVTTFVSYIIQSLYTYIGLQVYRLEVRPQFEVYSIYFGALGIFFVVVVISKCIKFMIST